MGIETLEERWNCNKS